MKNFTYYRPTSVEQAVGLLEDRWGNAELMAGGTDLLDMQKQYIAEPSRVVSLGGINGFSGIQVGNATTRILAGTTLSEIADHDGIKKDLPALAQAAGEVGGPQIRNMGTLGGNLCQRNRCWYFRDEHVDCWLKGGKLCYAVDGENRYHAIFAQVPRCVYVHPSTVAPALVALRASAEVQGPKGKRTIELENFFQAPNKPDVRETVLAPNEVVTAVMVPQGNASASYEVRHKLSYDWPLVQAAVAFSNNGGKVSNARVVLGHVATTPYIAEAAGKSLEGKAISEETAAAAGKAAATGAKPLSQNGYKVKQVEVAVKRALLLAAGQKPYWE